MNQKSHREHQRGHSTPQDNGWVGPSVMSPISALSLCLFHRPHFVSSSCMHGCQMAIARFYIVCVWPFGLLDYGSAMLRCKICSLPFLGLRPHALHPDAIQGKEGIKFCHLATLFDGRMEGRKGAFDALHRVVLLRRNLASLR